MKRVARFVRATGLTLGILVLVACTTPVAPTPIPTRMSLPTPVPTSTRPAATASRVPVRATAAPLPSVAPSATPRPHQYDDVDANTLMTTLFPDLVLAQNGDEFRVIGNADWTLWVNSRAEGNFTQEGVPQLAVIIANEAPNQTPADLQRSAPWGSFLALFERREGKLVVAQRSYLFPTDISPLAFDVNIERVVDFDHDNLDELLVTTAAQRLGITSTAAFLYMWNEQAFTEIWSAPVGEDNTGALNQMQYYASASEIRFADLDGNGLEKIVVDTTRIDYDRDANGLANTDREAAHRTERRVFKWNGNTFVPEPARATPMPPLPSPTP